MKDLGYYMSLLYDIKAKELPKDAGGGVFLSIPLLGEATVNAYGDTYEEARKTLESVKRDFFQMWLNENVDIPEPQEETERDFSGKILLRMSKVLHAKLAMKAEEEEISLNTLITNLINFALGGKTAVEEMASLLGDIEIRHVHQHHIAKVPPEKTEKMRKVTMESISSESEFEVCA